MDTLDVVVKEIDENVTAIKDFMALGNLKGFEEYVKLCGEIRGLLAVRVYISDLKHNLENSDE